MARFDAILLDYANTVVQFDRPQIERIHVGLAEFLTSTLGPIDARELGAVMDRVCVAAPLTPDRRELTPCEQMRRVLQECYGRPFCAADRAVVDADRAYQELFLASLAIDEHATDAVRRIGRRMPVGLVSNYPCATTLRRSLTALGIADLFDPIVISGEVGYVKPHPKLFRIAIEGLGAPADRVLFVGDSWACDMIGGRDAGMSTCHHVGLSSQGDHERRYRSYRPDFSIRHLAELERIIDTPA